MTFVYIFALWWAFCAGVTVGRESGPAPKWWHWAIVLGLSWILVPVYTIQRRLEQ